MQEIFFTILIIWILFRVLNGSGSRTVYYTQNNYHPREEKKDEGATRITHIPQGKPKKENDQGGGEYVDFEEIK